MNDWQIITNNPNFQAKDSESKTRILNNFFSKNIESNAKFQALPEERKLRIKNNFALEAGIGSSGDAGTPTPSPLPTPTPMPGLNLASVTPNTSNDMVSGVPLIAGERGRESIKTIEDQPEASWGEVLSSIPGGAVNQTAAGVGGIAQAVGEGLRMPKVAQWGKDVSQGIKQIQREEQPNIKSGVKGAVYGAGVSVVQNLMTLPLSIATGNPMPSLVAMGLFSGGQGYSEGREGGLTPAESLLYGVEMGGAEVATELGPTSTLLKHGLPLAKRMITHAIQEVFGETANTIYQDAAKQVALKPDATIGDFLTGLPPKIRDTVYQTLISSPFLSGASHALIGDEEDKPKPLYDSPVDFAGTDKPEATEEKKGLVIKQSNKEEVPGLKIGDKPATPVKDEYTAALDNILSFLDSPKKVSDEDQMLIDSEGKVPQSRKKPEIKEVVKPEDSKVEEVEELDEMELAVQAKKKLEDMGITENEEVQKIVDTFLDKDHAGKPLEQLLEETVQQHLKDQVKQQEKAEDETQHDTGAKLLPNKAGTFKPSKPAVPSGIKIEKEEETQPKPEKFHVTKSTGFTTPTFVETEGEKAVMPGFEEFDFFAHKTEDGEDYVITEVGSGMEIAKGSTKEEATAKALATLTKHGKEATQQAISAQIDSNGITPTGKRLAEERSKGTLFEPKKIEDVKPEADAQKGTSQIGLTEKEPATGGPVPNISQDSITEKEEDVKIEPQKKSADVDKVGRSGKSVFRDMLKISNIDETDTNATEYQSAKSFFDKYYNAGLSGEDMPGVAAHRDVATKAYNAGQKDAEKANGTTKEAVSKKPKADKAIAKDTADKKIAESDEKSQDITKPFVPQDKPSDEVKPNIGTIDNIDTIALAKVFKKQIDKGDKLNKLAIKSLVAHLLGVKVGDLSPNTPGYKHKAVEEAFEYALVQKGREIIASDLTVDEKYEAIKKVYENQPVLGERTSETIKNQAYSTPLPIAFLLNEHLKVDEDTSVLGITAGNGMLLVGANPNTTIANDIDDKYRGKHLDDIGFATTKEDALQFMNKLGQHYKGRFDVVVENPPFGKAPEVRKYDGFRVSKLEHQIVIENLKGMKDKGKGAFIIGGHNFKEGKMTETDRVFLNYLYSHYNISHNIDVDGDVYSRMGTKFPIRIITIEGRKPTPDKVFAPSEASQFESAKTFDDIRQILSKESEIVHGNNEDQTTGTPGEVDKGETSTTEDRPLRGKPETMPGTPRAGADGPVRPEVPDAGRSETNTGETGRPDGETKNPGSVERPGVGDKDVQPLGPSDGLPHRPARVKAKSEKEEIDTNEHQVVYVATSKGASGGNVAPKNIATTVKNALSSLAEVVGDVDGYVMNKLQYEDLDSLFDAFSAEQIDAIALAIHNIDNGYGFIVGDQTGVGKGRIVAGVIKYANLLGLKPVFITAKPNLFSDIYRDLIDIGHPIKPYILHGDATAKIVDADDNVLFKPQYAKDKEGIKGNPTATMEGYGAIFSVYTQFSKENSQRQIVRELAKGNVVILDESHEASGDSKRGEFLIDVLKDAKGVLYSSATYAKRPDTMPLYFRTALGNSGMDIDALIDAMKRGGVPLQQAVAKQLAEGGQYIRRELNFDGVTFETKVDTKNKDLHRDQADKIASILRDIIKFDVEGKAPIISDLDDEAKEEGELVEGSTETSAGVTSANFTSTIHNLVGQMLLGLKAETAIEEAVKAIKDGKKPVITMMNTMGSFLGQLVEEGGLKTGDEVGLTFGDVLRKALKSTLRYTKTSATGEKTSGVITKEDMPPEVLAFYEKIEKKINDFKTNMPASPIDYIMHKIRQAGYTIGEITGRGYFVDYSTPVPTLGLRTQTEISDRNSVVNKFNGGKWHGKHVRGTDALLINAAGSTGLSAHASVKVGDRRSRTMLIVQPNLNIDVFSQTLGRVFRKGLALDESGKELKPSYVLLQADLPSEIRPAIVLKKKMSSLNANTSADADSSVTMGDVPDMMNMYGDEVVLEYLKGNVQLNVMLGDPLKLLDEDATTQKEDAFRKVTGRLAILPVNIQAQFFAEIEHAYNELIEQMNERGENNLIAKDYDFKAKTENRRVIYQGTDESNPFSASAHLEKATVNVLKRPYTKAKLKDVISARLSTEDAVGDGKQGRLERIRNINRLLEDKTIESAERVRLLREKKDLMSGRVVGRFKQLQEINNLLRKESTSKSEKASLLQQRNKLLVGGIRASRIEVASESDTDNSDKQSVADKFNTDLIADIRSDAKVYLESVKENHEPERFEQLKQTNSLIIDRIAEKLNRFRIGHTYRLDSSFLPYNGVLVDIRRVKSGNPAAMSKVKLIFAANTNQQIKTIALSKDDELSMAMHLEDTVPEDWDSTSSQTSTEIRYIITGNVLAGFDRLKHKAEVINYTTFTGERKMGILVPRSVDVSSEFTQTSVGAKEAYASLTRNGNRISSTDGEVSISRRSGRYNIIVPKSKLRGAKYFLDKSLLESTEGGFVSFSSSSMVAYIDSDRLMSALEVLDKELGVRFLVESKEESPPPGGGGGVTVGSGSGSADVGGYAKDNQYHVDTIRQNLINGTVDLAVPKAALVAVGDLLNISINKSASKDQMWVTLERWLANRRGYAILAGEPTPTIEDQLAKLAPNYSGGEGDVGGYAQEGIEDEDKFVPIEGPELLELVKHLNEGKTPIVARKLRAMAGMARGYFRHTDAKDGVGGDAEILLHMDIFRGKDATKILAHEIGHLIDWLSDKTLGRGNIFGHLLSLKHYLTHTIDSLPGTTKKDIMKELEKLAHKWKPISKVQGKKYIQYRLRPTELYADAVSVMFNNPKMFEKYAPKAFDLFLRGMKKKPEVQSAYDAIQARIKEGRNAIQARRQRNTLAAYASAEAAWAKPIQEIEQKKFGYSYEKTIEFLKKELVDRHAPLYSGIANDGARQHVRNAVEDFLYHAAESEAYFKEVEDKVIAPFIKSGITEQQMGEYMEKQRVIHERKKIANPGMHDEKSSREALDILKAQMGETLYAKMEAFADQFLQIRMEFVIKRLKQSGMYTSELMKKIEQNGYYAKFAVVDYITPEIEKGYGSGIAAKIHTQYGTLKDIANPFTATIMQDMSLLRSVIRNNAVKTSIVALRDYRVESVEFQLAKVVVKMMANGTAVRVPVELPDGADLKLLTYMENGKVVGWYVPKDMATAFEANPLEAQGIIRVMTSINRPFKDLFTRKNPGFWTFNVTKDTLAAVKILPKASLHEFVPMMLGSIAEGYRGLVGYDPITQDILDGKGFIATINRDASSEDTQLERMRRMYAGGEAHKGNKLRRAARKFLDWLNLGGELSERITKIAAYKYLNKHFPEMSREDKMHLVRWVGSPAYLVKGEFTPAANSVLLFFNPFVQGTRIHVDAMKQRPLDYWWKTVKYNILPKVLMQLATYGLIDSVLRNIFQVRDDDDWIKKLMNRISDYNLLNYVAIPVGWKTDSAGNKKVMYVRIPQDEVGRVVGGLVVKAGDIIHHILTDKEHPIKTSDFVGLIDYGIGQLPMFSPALTAVVGVGQYITTGNAYDPFTGGYAVPREIAETKNVESLKYFGMYLANKLGVGVVRRFDLHDDVGKVKTHAEEVLGYPIISNIVGRIVQVSDVGVREDYQKASDAVRVEDARYRRNLKMAIIKINNSEPLKSLSKGQFEALNWFAANSTRREQQTKFDELEIKKINDPLLNAIQGARSKAEQAAILGKAIELDEF